MIKVECLYDQEYREEYAYTLSEYPWYDLVPSEKNGYDLQYATFDIETSNVVRDDEKYGFMYHWQWCFNGQVIFGRTWEEFISLIYLFKRFLHLDKDHKLVVYVHNLSFEFHFLYRFLEFNSIFALDRHKVARASLDFIEFRCSYILSNMSLKKFIENSEDCHHFKAADDLDYHVLRTPKSELTLKELGYCYNDVKGLWEAIRSSLKHDTLKSIPLTSTGYVRRDARMAMRKNRKNRHNFIDWQLDPDQYKMCREAFRGGNTASNRYLAMQILDDVDSYDISSEYPFCMIAYDYPTKFIEADIKSLNEILDYSNRGYAILARYQFKNLRLKENVPIVYISASKCLIVSKDAILYNGRILEASEVAITMTEVDLEIIMQEYDFDEIWIGSCYISKKARLPKEYIDVIFEYFSKKSLLKYDPTMQYEYFKAKNKLNSLYGMMATDIVRPEVIFENGEFRLETAKVDEALQKYYKSKNSFLSYQWGIYVTAYARRLLENALLAVGKDAVYCDTDSVKCFGNYADVFKKINDQINNYCLSKNIQNYIEVKGKRYYLGIFEHDAHYDRFITLGAKRYAFEEAGKLEITVAGISKSRGAEALKRLGGLEAFHDGVTFDNAGKTAAAYNNDQIHYINIKGEKILTASNICIYDVPYTLGVPLVMQDLINKYVDK